MNSNLTDTYKKEVSDILARIGEGLGIAVIEQIEPSFEKIIKEFNSSSEKTTISSLGELNKLILSSTAKIIEGDKFQYEFLLKSITNSTTLISQLSSRIDDSFAKIISDNSNNKSVVEEALNDLQLEIVNVVKKNEEIQSNKINNLDKSISLFIALQEDNYKKLDSKFDTLEKIKSEIAKTMDEKISFLKKDSEINFEKLTSKNNISIFFNIMMIILLILNLAYIFYSK